MEPSREPVNLRRFPVPRGELFLLAERCKECGFCWEFCPNEVLERSPLQNSRGYYLPQIVPGREDLCVACGMCTWVCPELAIYSLDGAHVAA